MVTSCMRTTGASEGSVRAVLIEDPSLVVDAARGIGGFPVALGGRGPAPGRHRRSWASVLALGKYFRGLLLVEGLVGGDDARRHRLTGGDLLGDVHQLRPEQRVALDEEVELAVGEGLHAVVCRIDRDDLD